MERGTGGQVMRIGYTYLHHGAGGGIERAASDLATSMAERGHDVHFHCAESSSAAGRVTLHRVHVPGAPNCLRLSSFAVAAQRQIARGAYDIVHSHGSIIGGDVITAHSCHRAGLRIVSAIPAGVTRSGRNYGLADAVRLHIERRNFAGRSYRSVIAVSRGVKEELVAEYGVPPDDIHVIPNGIRTDRFPGAKNPRIRLEVRSRLAIPSSTLLLLFVGNEFARKGLADAIAALQHIDTTDLLLLVAGSDDAEPYARLAREMGVHERVRFLGHQDDIDGIYQASDLFVFPSRYEASSLAVLEAAAAGLPLILTRFHGAEDLLEEGKTGFSVDRDPVAIARALTVCIGDAALVRTMGDAARARAQQFDILKVTSRVLDVYQAVLNAGGH
jgi:UDP-glucose:(heptosyl)LPS alpha-1,3-glucosyltransferase